MNASRRSVGEGRQSGVSLIELMVALLLGAIIVGGLIQILSANRKAYQLQEGNNFQQQNLRFASDRIDWSLRMADFWGGATSSEITGLLNDGAGASGCNAAWILSGKNGSNGAGGVFGYDGNTSFPIAGCSLVPDSDYVQGSDVLILRYADTDPCSVPDGSHAALSTTTTASCKPFSSHYLVANVGQQAKLFAKGSAIPVTGDTRRYIYPYRMEAYYLQPCTDRASGTCSATSDGGNPVPSLMRIRLSGDGSLVREPLVVGIEQLQFEYGVSTDGSHVSEFKIANEVTTSEWPKVLAVRVTLLARNENRDIAVSHAGTFKISDKCSYTITNSGSVTLANTGNDCTGFSLSGLRQPNQFPRQILQQIVQIRNRTRG
ncbi:MAG: PilW family protein [Pseudomonadota bacterium]|nr:PilW family protein [Pseudomonadota bacterium]